MKCIRPAIVLMALCLPLMCGATALAQTTEEDAIEAAENAYGDVNTATTNGKTVYTDAFASKILGGYTQIGRIITNFNQFTAQDLISCAGHTWLFYGHMKSVAPKFNTANGNLNSAKVAFINGMEAYLGGNFAAAETYFLGSGTNALQAYQGYTNTSDDLNNMQSSVNSLKAIIDNVLD